MVSLIISSSEIIDYTTALDNRIALEQIFDRF